MAIDRHQWLLDVTETLIEEIFVEELFLEIYRHSQKTG